MLLKYLIDDEWHELAELRSILIFGLHGAMVAKMAIPHEYYPETLPSNVYKAKYWEVEENGVVFAIEGSWNRVEKRDDFMSVSIKMAHAARLDRA